MDITITEFYNTSEPENYSASVNELGASAGTITWNNAMHAEYIMLDTPEKLQAMRNWAISTGAWSEIEVAAYPDIELNALFIQLVAGDIREKGSDNWQEYAALSEAGQVSGALFEGIDGQIYYSLDEY